MNSKSPGLLPYRDYTVRADGAWVFSREYLLARGTCCGSRCLHCPYQFSRDTELRAHSRPVISMVPSWTETLIHAGANVVGRTRFCIHPHDLATNLPSFGGTKTLATDIDSKMQNVLQSSTMRPLVILDREENPKDFFTYFSKYRCDIAVTEVTDTHTLIQGLDTLAVHFSPRSNVAPYEDEVARQLRSFSARSRQLITDSELEPVGSSSKSSSLGSAFIKATVTRDEIDRMILETNAPIFYFIWKNPWMTISSETWIADVLKRRFETRAKPFDVHRIFSGIRDHTVAAGASKYPEVGDGDVTTGSILLFSSEPYPFARDWEDLLKLDFVRRARAVALVDGERFSWFGIRAIRFLEER